MELFLFLYVTTLFIISCESNSPNNSTTTPFCLRQLGLFNKTTSTSTPKDCTTTILPDAVEFKCRKGLVYLPNSVPKQTVLFSYTYSRIANDSLTRSVVKFLVDVKSINLTANLIRTISRDAFADLKILEKLYLDQNPIANIYNRASLVHLPVNLRLLSLQEILPDGMLSENIWRLFTTKMFDNYKHSSNFSDTNLNLISDNTTYSNLNKLRVLKIDKNRLLYLNFRVLLKTNILNNLEILSLSKNFLTGKDLDILLHQASNRKNASSKFKQSLQIDLTYNNLEVVRGSTLNLLNNSNFYNTTVFQKNITTNIVELSQFEKFTIHLKGNPIDCSCRMKLLLFFLFENNGLEIFKDWRLWRCHKPLDLFGLALPDLKRLKIHICFSDWGGEKFSFSPAQKAFIVISGTILSLVSLAVCYLNRRKLMVYCKILRNCGEDEEYQNTVMFRGGTVNKYSIPNDHKGIGHRGYFEEERIFISDDDDEDVKL